MMKIVYVFLRFNWKTFMLTFFFWKKKIGLNYFCVFSIISSKRHSSANMKQTKNRNNNKKNIIMFWFWFFAFRIFKKTTKKKNKKNKQKIATTKAQEKLMFIEQGCCHRPSGIVRVHGLHRVQPSNRNENVNINTKPNTTLLTYSGFQLEPGPPAFLSP